MQHTRQLGTSRTLLRLVLLAMATLALVMGLAACGGSNAQQASGSSSASSVSLGQAEEPTDMGKTGTNVYGETVSLAPKGTKNILVIGDDSWEHGGTPGNADMMCILHVDFDNHEITQLSISRETRYYSEEQGMDVKLNSVLASTGSAREQTVAAGDTIGMPIDFYVHVGFDDLMAIVDHFGGVDVDLPYPTSYYFYTHDYPDEDYEAGEQTLDSWRAMAISRSRTGYTSQSLPYPEAIRQYVDRMMLRSLMQAAYNDPDGIPVLFKALEGYVDSNIPADTMIEWAEALSEEGSITVYGTTGPYATAIDDDNGSVYLVTPDPEGWANMIAAVNERGDLQAAFDTFETTEFAENIEPVTTSTITVGK